jgi:chromosome segregation ATPase
MTDRLDRIEAILLSTSERLNDSNATLNQTNATLSQTNAALRQTNVTLDRVAQQQERNTTDIDALLGAISTTDVEVRAIASSVSDSARLFENLRGDAMADRQRSDQRFNELLGRLDAQGEVIQALLLELTRPSDPTSPGSQGA